MAERQGARYPLFLGTETVPFETPKPGTRKERKAGTPKEVTFQHEVPPVYTVGAL